MGSLLQRALVGVNGECRVPPMQWQAAKVLPGGCTKGELTLVGQQQALELGQFLRRRYVDQLGFLPEASTAGAVAGGVV